MTRPARTERRRPRSSHPTLPRGVLTAVLALLPVAAPPPDTTVLLRPPRYTHAQMEAAMIEGERVRCVYGTRDPAATPSLRERARWLARQLFGGDSTLAIADRDLDAGDLARSPVLLLGGPDENRWSARLAPALPVRFSAHAFEWAGRRYDRPGDVLHLVFPNPLAPQRFLLMIAGNSPAAISRRGGGMLFGAEDWRIERDGELARSGRFADSPRPWSYDPALDHDREQERERFSAELVSSPAGRGGIVVRASADQAVLRAKVAAASEIVGARLHALGIIPARGEPIRVTLYHSLEEKGVLARDARPEQLDPGGEPQVALPAGNEMPDLWSVAAAMLSRAGAARDSRFLGPAGVWCARRFEGEPLEVPVSRLYFGRLLPRAGEAASRPARWRSPLVLTPARALLFAAFVEVAGPRAPQAIDALLRTDPPGDLDSLCRLAKLDPVRVERRYDALGDSLARAGQAAARAGVPRSWRPVDGFQRGVCVANAVGPEQGYLSPACGRQLDALRAMGADGVSLTPFGYLPPQGDPEIWPSVEGGPEGETDEAVAEAAAMAHARGMKVWLKPRLWTRGWVGGLTYTPAGWTAFFERYREFILHQALLAQRERIEGLLVGQGLVSATAAHPERWRAIIAEVRRVYDGTLGYGADWDEAKDVGFWDALDVIGVSAYGPLSDAPTTDPRTLRGGAAHMLADLRAVATRWGRPVLLTETGYAPTAAAPVRPWEEGLGTVDLESQRACYEALVRALDRETWVAGVYWWDWSSSDRGGGPGDRGFTPRGKPAEAVMRRAMSEWRDRPVLVPGASR